MALAYIALGGNLGPVLQTFGTAVSMLSTRRGHVARVSPAYRTAAWTKDPTETQPDYWNAVCEFETELTPLEVLRELRRVEEACGRERTTRWAPRRLDLDLLVMGAEVLEHPELALPHPGILDRPFVLWPLGDLAPDLAIPPTEVTVSHAKAALEARSQNLGLLEMRKDWWAG